MVGMRRRLLLPVRRVVAVVLVAATATTTAGCGRDGAAERADGSATTSTTAAGDTAAPTTGPAGPTTTPATAAGAPRTGSRSAPGAATTTRPAAGAATPTTAADADPTAPAPGSAAAAPTVTDDGHTGPPGAFARTLLRPQPATTVALERQQQSGAGPAAASFAFARDTVQRVTQKPVNVPATVALPGAGRAWTADELRSLADASGRAAQGNGTAVIRILFVRGTFEGDDQVLGVTVRGDVVAVFTDAVAGATTPVLSGDTIEEAVLVHELGHVLGLVDLARDTGRADKDHPGHSTNTKSVMYWAVESSLVGQVLGGPPPRDFDAADLADLGALRNGA